MMETTLILVLIITLPTYYTDATTYYCNIFVNNSRIPIYPRLDRYILDRVYSANSIVVNNIRMETDAAFRAVK